jgi:hypothetical protein
MDNFVQIVDIHAVRCQHGTALEPFSECVTDVVSGLDVGQANAG